MEKHPMCTEWTPKCEAPEKDTVRSGKIAAIVHSDGNKCSALKTTERKSPMEAWCYAIETFVRMSCYWLYVSTRDVLKWWLNCAIKQLKYNCIEHPFFPGNRPAAGNMEEAGLRPVERGDTIWWSFSKQQIGDYYPTQQEAGQVQSQQDGNHHPMRDPYKVFPVHRFTRNHRVSNLVSIS